MFLMIFTEHIKVDDHLLVIDNYEPVKLKSKILADNYNLSAKIKL